MSEHDALLAAILESPADDTPRFVFADWLDEHAETVDCSEDGCGNPAKGWNGFYPCSTCHGTGRIDNGYAERAEFIRVQIELARQPRRLVIEEECPVTTSGPNYYLVPTGARIAGRSLMAVDAKPGDRIDVMKPHTHTGRHTMPLLGLRFSKVVNDADLGGDCVLVRDEHSGPDPADALRCREWDLVSADIRGPKWFPVLPGGIMPKLSETRDPQDIAIVRRGFVSSLRCSWPKFREHGAAILAGQPVERVVMGGVTIWVLHPEPGRWDVSYGNGSLSPPFGNPVTFHQHWPTSAALVAGIVPWIAERMPETSAGVRESQWLNNFQWDVGPSGVCEPIPEPGDEP